MARGNQRDQAREKAAKANKVLLLKYSGFIYINHLLRLNLDFVKRIDLCPILNKYISEDVFVYKCEKWGQMPF